MRGPEQVSDVLVVLRTMAFVAHNKTDRCASGFPFKDTTEHFHLIVFLSIGRYLALPWLAAIELTLNELHINVYSGWHSVNNATYCSAMALAKGRQCEKCSESIVHLLFVLCYE